MYMQNDIVAAATKGPYIDEPKIDPTVRRAELDHVIAAATAALPKPTLRKLGRLSFAAAMDDDDHSYFGQIRSEPIGRTGVEFRFAMPARNTGGQDLGRTVDNLVAAAVATANVVPKLKPWRDLIREIAERAIAPATAGIARMRVVAIGATAETAEGRLVTTVDVEMLGCDLKSGIERVSEVDYDRLEEKLDKLVATHLARCRTLAQVMVAGGTGWVEDAALRIIDAAGLDRVEILEMLRRGREVGFSFGGEEGYDLMGGVHWENGTVRGYIENRYRGGIYRLEAGTLLIEAKGLPATIIADLVGRRLREVVDLAVIPPNALILDVKESGEWLYLDLEIGRSLIDRDMAPTR